LLLQGFFDQAVQPGVKIETLLKVLKYLDKERKELEEKLGVNTAADSAETYLKLNGPVTRVETSIMVTASMTPVSKPFDQ